MTTVIFDEDDPLVQEEVSEYEWWPDWARKYNGIHNMHYDSIAHKWVRYLYFTDAQDAIAFKLKFGV